MSAAAGIGIEEDHRFEQPPDQRRELGASTDMHFGNAIMDFLHKAGYRKLRTVDVRNELEALAVGSVVADYFDVPHVKAPNGMWWVNDGRTAHDMALPATVLHETKGNL